MSASPSWACPACGAPHELAASSCAQCGADRPATAHPPVPRLKFFWFAWMVATIVFHGLGWWFMYRYFPWRVFPEGAVAHEAAIFVCGCWAGLFVGWAQCSVLRIRIRGRAWMPWVWLTALAYGGTTMIQDLFWEGAFPKEATGLTWGAIRVGLLCGLVPGVLQLGFLKRRFPGAAWWPWIPVNVLGWVLLSVTYGLVHGRIPGGAGPDWASAVPLGLITGIGLEVLARRVPKSGAPGTEQPVRPSGFTPGPRG